MDVKKLNKLIKNKFSEEHSKNKDNKKEKEKKDNNAKTKKANNAAYGNEYWYGT